MLLLFHSIFLNGHHYMKEIEFEVKGKAAIALLLLAVTLAFLGYRNDKADFQKNGKDAIRYYLYLDYLRQGIPALDSLVISDLAESEIDSQVHQFLGQKNITLGDATIRRDVYMDDTYIVRIEIESVNGRSPPDGRDVRYLEVQRILGRWIVSGDSYESRFSRPWYRILF